MVFEDLRVRPQSRASSAWANAVVDALEQVYALAKRGDPDRPFDELYANRGHFNDNVYVQGKPVLKDGDPITVSDLGDDAKQKISQAIDSSEILNEFKPVSVKGSISASDNTSGFSIVIDKGGRHIVNVYYKLSGAGIIYIKVSNDGHDWKTLDVITLPGADEDIKIYTWIAYRYVMVETNTSGIDVTFEITVTR